jgi:hypothetical protein
MENIIILKIMNDNKKYECFKFDVNSFREYKTKNINWDKKSSFANFLKEELKNNVECDGKTKNNIGLSLKFSNYNFQLFVVSGDSENLKKEIKTLKNYSDYKSLIDDTLAKKTGNESDSFISLFIAFIGLLCEIFGVNSDVKLVVKQEEKPDLQENGNNEGNQFLSIDECLQQIEEEEAAKQKLKSPSL